MLRIGVPSKGRLMEGTIAWFAARGLTIAVDAGTREYAGEISGIDGLSLVLLPAGDITRELAAGGLHLGVTGSDLVTERLTDWPRQVAHWQGLGFGGADLVLAVPAAWVDVETVDDLDAVAAGFRAAHGHRLRIATKYHRLVRAFMAERGVADYALVDSGGATEGTVKNRLAEAVADITSTGETLRANHLKILEDGLIHRSQATLYLGRRAGWAGEEARLAALARRLGLSLPEGF